MKHRNGVFLAMLIMLAGLYVFTSGQSGCEPPLTGHNLDRYTAKEVFLVSDRLWYEVLTLMPAATWEDASGILHTYPFLIYHLEESGAFDADAIMTFLKRYEPDKVYAIGALPALLENAIDLEVTKEIDVNQIGSIFDFWNADETGIVYSRADYEIAQLAAVYASLRGLPLLIEETLAFDFTGKNVSLVGDVDCPAGAASCTLIANDAAMMREILAIETGGEKLILVRPDDLGIHETGVYFPDYGDEAFTEFSGKMSLAAPTLAAAKGELIIAVSAGDPESVDAELEAEISRLGITPEYLTILASPDAITMGVEVSGNYQYEMDYQVYGSLGMHTVPAGLGLYGNDMLPDLYTGRIFGVTVADASAYVANVLFYLNMSTFVEPSKVSVPCNKAAIEDDGASDHIHIANRWAAAFADSGVDYAYNGEEHLEEAHYENVSAVYYAGHGYQEGAGFLTSSRLQTTIDDLFPAVSYISACQTCQYSAPFASTLLCAQHLRNGGLGFVGAVGYGNDENKVHLLANLLAGGMDLGQAFIGMRKEIFNRWYFDYMSSYVLIGDPTFTPTNLFPVDESYLPEPIVTETNEEGQVTVQMGFEEPINMAEMQLYQMPVMPSHQNESELWGIPTVHYEFPAITGGLTGDELTVLLDLGDGTSMEATLGSCDETDSPSGFFPYRYLDCAPMSIRVCIDGACSETAGGFLDGVSISGGDMLIDYRDGARAYNLMATTFEIASSSDMGIFLHGAPVRDNMAVELRLKHRVVK